MKPTAAPGGPLRWNVPLKRAFAEKCRLLKDNSANVKRVCVQSRGSLWIRVSPTQEEPQPLPVHAHRGHQVFELLRRPIRVRILTHSHTHAHTHTLSVTPSNWIKAGSFSSQWRKRWGEEEDWQVDEEVPRCIVGKKELRQPETEELRRERSRVFIRTSLFFAVLTWLQHVRGVVTSSSPCGWPGRCFTAFRSFNCRMFLFGVSWLRLTLPGPNYLILQKKTRKPLKLELWQQASKNVTWDEFTTQTGNRIGAVYCQTF